MAVRAIISINRSRPALTTSALRVAYYAFLITGIVALGIAGYATLDRYWFQSRESSILEMARPSAIPEAPAAIPSPPIADGSVIGEMEVPRVGLKAVIVQGDSPKLLRRSVGHLPETAMPGEAGNVALAGHRDGLFRPLRNAQPGDLITLKTRDHEFQYQIEWTAIVPPSATQVIQPTSEPVLTLVTCYPFYFVGSAPERFVVRARKIPVNPMNSATPGP